MKTSFQCKVKYINLIKNKEYKNQIDISIINYKVFIVGHKHKSHKYNMPRKRWLIYYSIHIGGIML